MLWIRVVPSHGQESGEEGSGRREEHDCPAGAAAASVLAREQSHRSSALPGLVSVTTISILESTYRSEPTWRLWSGPLLLATSTMRCHPLTAFHFTAPCSLVAMCL